MVEPVPQEDVPNQPPPFAGYDLFRGDRALAEGLEREGAGWAAGKVAALAEVVGSERVQYLAWQANRNLPELRTYDRYGHRIDAVEFHPAYHELMGLAFGGEVHSLAWTAKRPGAQLARAALSYLWNQAENGVACPVAMTFAAVRPLRAEPSSGAVWEKAILANSYDPRPMPVQQKTGATIGMTFTERQGGSDLRANTTRARALGAGGPGGEYAIDGHKWFCSAPMSDAFFTLACTEKGPSFFFVPRSLPDGARNPFHLLRLKEKCGNRSNASSEVEFRGTRGFLVGEEGRGIRHALEMAHYTRV
jgi:putative acyl-CoA dehydrogenase